MMKSIDIKIVNFLRKTCNWYLKKRNSNYTINQTPKQNKIQLHILPHIPLNSKLNYVDIGAHKGHFVDEILNYYQLNKAVLIEPIPHLFEFLKVKYKPSNYIILQNLVSNSSNIKTKFNINELAETSSILEFDNKIKELSNINIKKLEVQDILTLTLDDIISANNVNYIDLLKIDVQGAEHLVLEGGINTLKKTKFIWVELSFLPLYKNSLIFGEIQNLLKKQNFKLIEIAEGHRGPDKELLQVDALFFNCQFKSN